MSVEDTVKQIAGDFYPYAQNRLGFDKPAQIEFLNDPQNAEDPLGKTAYYDPETMTVSVYIVDRHPKDILRSLSHELVHHTQNCRGEFVDGIAAEDGYAQNNEHLREMEREAYEMGNLVFRDWEDEVKAQKPQKENLMEHFDKRREKLNKELMKKFGLVPKPKETESESNKKSDKSDK